MNQPEDDQLVAATACAYFGLRALALSRPLPPPVEAYVGELWSELRPHRQRVKDRSHLYAVPSEGD